MAVLLSVPIEAHEMLLAVKAIWTIDREDFQAEKTWFRSKKVIKLAKTLVETYDWPTHNVFGIGMRVFPVL